ncbi:MAG: FHA domain-containing protein [Anaerolineae bacterium]|nr:FHA domain-containing protein [Anaerolineae bacterium]
MRLSNRRHHKTGFPLDLTGFKNLSGLLLLLFLFVAQTAVSPNFIQPVFSQESPGDLIQITDVDDSEFPLIKVTLLTIGQNGRFLDLAGLSLRENGIPVAYEPTNAEIGLDAIFVIDANETLLTDDTGGGLSRADQVNASINQFASSILRPELDTVSVIVPDDVGANGRLLIQDSADPQAINDALASYTPLGAWPTPLQDMLIQAIDQAIQSKENGRFPTILLFTDAGRIHLQLDYDQLLQSAQAHDIPISGAILGTQTTEEELFRINRLTQATRGTTLSMPDSAALEPLLAQWQQQGYLPQLQYLSLQNRSGQYPIAINLGQQRITSELDLELLPPTLTLQPATTEITRSGPAHDTPVTDLEPKQTLIPVQISWPDEKPRALTAVVWQVNGVRQPQMNTLTPNTAGQLMLSWNMELADAGSYEFMVDAVDELGLTAKSEPVTLEIVAERPLAPTTTPSPTATPEPEPITPESMNVSLWLPILGGLGLTAVILLLIRSRRQPPPTATDAASPAPTDLPPLPAESAAPPTTAYDAYLDPLNQPDSEPILLEGDNIIIGRDEAEATLILTDKSVARLHARIARQNDSYWLYDEGSAHGTYLNYTRLGLAPKAITDNDVISIGRLQFRFKLRIRPKENHAAETTEDDVEA